MVWDIRYSLAGIRDKLPPKEQKDVRMERENDGIVKYRFPGDPSGDFPCFAIEFDVVFDFSRMAGHPRTIWRAVRCADEKRAHQVAEAMLGGVTNLGSKKLAGIRQVRQENPRGIFGRALT